MAELANEVKISLEKQEPMNVNEAIKTTEDVIKTSMFPTQIVELPSKGLPYPPESPLSSGTVEIKYITAKEEDILTTESYIRSGVVIDKLLQSLLVTKVDYNELLVGDRNAIMIAARLYGYGKDYEVTVTTPSGTEQKVTVDLEEIKPKEFDESQFVSGNSFEYQLPLSKAKIQFRLLTMKDQSEIDDRIKKHRLKTKSGARDIQLTTRLFQMIQSVNGNLDRNYIKLFVEEMPALDTRAFRAYIKEIQPDIELTVDAIDEETGEPFRSDFSLDARFFWPDSGV